MYAYFFSSFFFFFFVWNFILPTERTEVAEVLKCKNAEVVVFMLVKEELALIRKLL